ncbi:hypothetical protein QNI23_016865 [Bermanella sp. WJH001]|uniref:hypothetical protein n=1 Tax=Bermanella sp. WJH001 TaxID=3048005 RepID=UPI0024BD8713|nr:hypothetical protein [Bermanella sp. WJH001]MDJ1538884.1 hypothetical protein [Bermanella sp. WJH001]
MTLTGNKLLSVAVVLAASQIVQAENITAPDLVRFEAGTPAKASEVNGNFEGLKSYGEGLHGLVEDQATRISDLETSTEALSVTLGGHTTDITELQTSNTTNTAAITTLQTDTGTNGSNITALQTSVITNTSNIAALETSTSTNISSLQATTTTNATAISALESSDTSQDGLISAQANLINALEARIEELESGSDGSGDAFNIAVYGDGDLIGYTNKVNAFSPNKHFIPLKTSYGMLSLESAYDPYSFRLRNYDSIRNDRAGESSYLSFYSDDTCETLVYALGSGDGNSVVLTKVANTLDETILFATEDKLYQAAAGTILNNNATDIYAIESDTCTHQAWFTSGLTIPVTEITDLKVNYTTLEVDGYVTN